MGFLAKAFDPKQIAGGLSGTSSSGTPGQSTMFGGAFNPMLQALQQQTGSGKAVDPAAGLKKTFGMSGGTGNAGGISSLLQLLLHGGAGNAGGGGLLQHLFSLPQFQSMFQGGSGQAFGGPPPTPQSILGATQKLNTAGKGMGPFNTGVTGGWGG